MVNFIRPVDSMTDNSQVAFVLGSATTRLQIGASSRLPIAAASHASPLTGSCSFKSSSARINIKRGKSPFGNSAFASLSMQLPCFAAATLAPPAKGKASAAAPAAPAKKKKSMKDVLDNAAKKALQGGIPGMVAMALQVLSLMWLRSV